MRIFDCKVAADQPIIDALPHAADYLCDACGEHFDATKAQLTALALDYRVSHRLVRGLDYYTRTTFEILAENLGAQNALLGGGRYDGLVRRLGGPDRAGIGFAAGLERLVLAMSGTHTAQRPDAFIVAIGDDARQPAHLLARDIRHAGMTALIDYDARSLRAQMKRADRTGARRVLIVGGDELARGEVTIKDMESGEQTTVPRPDVVAQVVRSCASSPFRVAVGDTPDRA